MASGNGVEANQDRCQSGIGRRSHLPLFYEREEGLRKPAQL